MKTLAIKLEDDTHAQLTAIAQLEGKPIIGVIREAIDSAIEVKRKQPGLSGKAESMLEEIERDAAARRQAVAALFEPTEETPQASEAPDAGGKSPQRRSRGKGGEPASS